MNRRDPYAEIAAEEPANQKAPPIQITDYLNMVSRIAAHFRGRLPAAIDHNDLVQAGIVGLIEAVNAYDDTRGTDFESFAKLRVRGAMLDEIRGASWAPRSTVKVAVEARQIENRIVAETGVPATHAQVAKEMGLDLSHYQKLRGRNQGLADVGSVEELPFASDLPGPDELVDKQLTLTVLEKALAELPERERLVVALYYDEELTLKEIGAVMEVSESRVSQILTAVAKKLNAAIAH
jgi:RNA polymerase sigma factor FliA